MRYNRITYLIYYIFSRKFRILASNVWFRKDVYWTWAGRPHIAPRLETDKFCYISESGIYKIDFSEGLKYISIYEYEKELNFNNVVSFYITNENIDSSVSKFFIDNFKERLIEGDDIISYKRNKKLNELI